MPGRAELSEHFQEQPRPAAAKSFSSCFLAEQIPSPGMTQELQGRLTHVGIVTSAPALLSSPPLRLGTEGEPQLIERNSQTHPEIKLNPLGISVCIPQ